MMRSQRPNAPLRSRQQWPSLFWRRFSGVMANQVNVQMEERSNSISMRDLVFVAIRILAINLGLEGLGFLPRVLSGYRAVPSMWVGSLAFATVVLIALLLWQSAGFVARCITRSHDSSLDCGNLTPVHLYTAIFLVVGLYFAVDSLGPSLTWLHYSLRQSSSGGQLSLEQKANFYSLFKYLMRLALGLALIFNGRRFAVKLMKRHEEA